MLIVIMGWPISLLPAMVSAPASPSLVPTVGLEECNTDSPSHFKQSLGVLASSDGWARAKSAG